jgi:hypothetical protein
VERPRARFASRLAFGLNCVRPSFHPYDDKGEAVKEHARGLSIVIAIALVVQLTPSPTRAFTQSGFGTVISNAVPMGHEWITRRAAVELLLKVDPVVPPDPNDPRKAWTKGLAKNLSLAGAESEVARILRSPVVDSRYQAQFRPVYDAIIGERWVDIGGFNVTNSNLPGNTNCWDAVAQEPAEIQYDHFMRRYDEVGGPGGVTAATNSQQRFIQFFVDAATAPATSMLVWDGGGSAAQEKVDRNYFLFGRAAHLFEDSFSSEHTVRIDTDNHEKVRQVKSYLCALGSEQHAHAKSAIFDYTSGDVIWLPGTQYVGTSWATYKPSFMKTTALVAMEATKDLWAAFIRTMATPMPQREAKARSEAQTLVDNWLSFDPAEMDKWYSDPAHRIENYVLNTGETAPGQTQSACMQNLGVASGRQSDKVAQLQSDQRLCLFNTQPVPGYADLFDPQIHMYYNWQWVSSVTWNKPPASWTIPQRPADTGRRVQVSSVSARQPMSAPLLNNAAIQVNGNPAVDFIVVGDDNGAFLRTTYEPYLFLSYAATADGTVKLWNGTKQSSYKLTPVNNGPARSIMNLYWSQYIWADGKGNVYLTKAGSPGNQNAQWILVGQMP